MVKTTKMSPQQPDFYQEPFYKTIQRMGHFPKVFGVISGPPVRSAKPLWKNRIHGVEVVQYIPGINTLEYAKANPRDAAIKLADLDYELKRESYRNADGKVVHNMDVSGDSVILSKQTGKLVIVDYDIGQSAPLSMTDALQLDFYQKAVEYGPAVLRIYVKRTLQRYSDRNNPLPLRLAFEKAFRELEERLSGTNAGGELYKNLEAAYPNGIFMKGHFAPVFIGLKDSEVLDVLKKLNNYVEEDGLPPLPNR